jgi:hypothetical protein
VQITAHNLAQVVEQVVDSKIAVAPPLIISGTSLLGIPWQQWAYITATVYSVLLIIGWVWKAVRRWRA